MKTLLAFAAGAMVAGGVVWIGMRPPAPEPAETRQPPLMDLTPPVAPERQPEAGVKPEPEQPPVRTAKRPVRPFRAPAAPAFHTEPAEIPSPPPLETAQAPQPGTIRLATLQETPPPPEPNRVTIDAGTVLHIILGEDLSSATHASGDSFAATLDRELVVDGFIIAERGSRVEGRIVEADPPGKVKGRGLLGLQLTHLHTADGQRVEIVTDVFRKEGDKETVKDAAKVGAAASIGALIGGIAGGGKGAAIGAAIGGGAGAGTVLATRGAPAKLPAETRMPFRISSPVTITERLS